jgi:hypothetical protein
MPQDATDPNPSNDPAQDEVDAPATEDIGGVQGTPPEEGQDDDDGTMSAAMSPGGPEDRPAPDSGEIEWAGQVVKKPPHPGA